MSVNVRNRVVGALLLAGVLAWTTSIISGLHTESDAIDRYEAATGTVFMIGVIALVWLVRVTGGCGDCAGRFIPLVLLVTMPIAVAYNVVTLNYTRYDDLPGWTGILDVRWPLSMLGMLVLAIAVVRVKRYVSLVRWQFLLCGLWLPATMLPILLLGRDFGTYFGYAWLLLSYGALGVHLLVRPAVMTP